MAESKKTSTPVKPKAKDSLLDMDIGKDFLGSWKSMSMGDDGMDFDFGPTTKGKQKAFKFDKMDMDFSLDADFAKLPSFKMDMSGLDISSPAKKSGKSKEVSSGGANQAGKESFGFSFDFDEFADFGFDSKKKKIEENSNKSKDKEGYIDTSNSGGSGDILSKDVDASQDDNISLKHSPSLDVTNSKVDTQMDNIKDPDPRNETDNLKSAIVESFPSKPANSEEEETLRTTEHTQESLSSDKIYSPEPLALKAVQNTYVNSQDSNVSIEGTCSDVHEESRTLVSMVCPSTGDEQNDNVSPVAELVPTRNFSADTEALSEKGEMYEMRDDNVITDHIDGSATFKADSHLESSVTPGIENLAHEELTDKTNTESFSKLQVDLPVSGATIDELATCKEKGNGPVLSKYFNKQYGSESELQQAADSSTQLTSIGNKRTNTLSSNPALEKSGTRADETATCKEKGNIPVLSKYFNKQNGSESELKQVSASSTKLTSIGNNRMNTLSSNPALEKREFGARSLESASKFSGLSRSLPKLQSTDIPARTETTEASHVKSLDSTSECLNADNIRLRNEPMVTTVAHDISPMKETPVPKGSDQNSEHINAHRFEVHPSSSNEQLRKNTSLNIINPGTSTHKTREFSVRKGRISPNNTEVKPSEVSTVSRATEPKLKPLSYSLPKGLTSMRNKDQGPELQGNMVFKSNLSVDPEKQTPPTPSLKRKTFEESADIPRLPSFKRLSASPSSYNIRASMEKVVKEQGCNQVSMAHVKSPRLDVSLTKMDTSSSIEDDSIFEKAEACSKELEDICNMLKKKHEEANEILVRAIVNNNNLLMLNHPIYQDKIRMAQKFAELLMLK